MYSDDRIPSFSPSDHVRLRPGMYLGGIDERALYEWLYTPINEAIELAVNGYSSNLNVTLRQNNEIMVSYDGPGIPTHIIEDKQARGLSALELMMTQNMTWNKDYSDIVSGGMFGIRLMGLNALAAELTVESRWHGSLWQQHYREGKRVSEVEQVRLLEPDEETGVTLTFTPDFTILEPNTIDFDKLSKRLQETAWLTPQFTVVLRDERVQPTNETTFHYENGLSDYVQHLNQGKQALTPIIAGEQEIELPSGYYRHSPFAVHFAFQYTDSHDTTEISYVSHWKTTHGGVHVAAFRTALFSALTQYPLGYTHKSKIIHPTDIAFDAVFPGLTAVVHILHPDPQFTSQTEIRLIMPGVYGPISGAVFTTIESFLNQNPEVAQAIIEKCLHNQRELFT